MSKRSRPVCETVGGRLVPALAMMAAVITIQAILGASPALALTERPDKTYTTNGKVYATALSADTKTRYIGGNFSEVRERPSGTTGRSLAVSNVAAINVETGVPIRTWRPRVTGDGAVVRSLALRNDRVYIGGNFTAVNIPGDPSKPRQNLAAVGANDSRLYAGGGFSKVDGQPRKNLAAFGLATGALTPDWKPATSVAPSCT